MALLLSTPQTNNSVNGRNSRYSMGGTTDVYANRLGWWERKIHTISDDDIIYTIQPYEHQRPDILAYRVYGKSSLMWTILQYNSIVDVTTEFVTGKDIRLPSEQRIYLEFMSGRTGGNRVT